MESSSETSANESLVSVRLSRLVKQLRDVLLFTSAYLALIAGAEVLIVTALLDLPLTLAPVVATLLTFAVYGNDRVADAETDEKTAPARTAFVRRYNRLLYTLSAVAYGFAVALAVLGGPAAFALALVPGAVWVLYAQDWLPFAGTFRRLKQVFILNSVVVAGAWALVIVFLPVAFAGAAVTPAATVVSLLLFLAAFVSVEVPNVRDRAGDREIGVKTLPVVLGVGGTRYFLYSVVGLGIATASTAFVTDILSWTAAAGFVLSLLVLLGISGCLGRVDSTRALTVTAECSRLPLLVVVAVGAI